MITGQKFLVSVLVKPLNTTILALWGSVAVFKANNCPQWEFAIKIFKAIFSSCWWPNKHINDVFCQILSAKKENFYWWSRKPMCFNKCFHSSSQDLSGIFSGNSYMTIQSVSRKVDVSVTQIPLFFFWLFSILDIFLLRYYAHNSCPH